MGLDKKNEQPDKLNDFLVQLHELRSYLVKHKFEKFDMQFVVPTNQEILLAIYRASNFNFRLTPDTNYNELEYLMYLIKTLGWDSEVYTFLNTPMGAFLSKIQIQNLAREISSLRFYSFGRVSLAHDENLGLRQLNFSHVVKAYYPEAKYANSGLELIRYAGNSMTRLPVCSFNLNIGQTAVIGSLTAHNNYYGYRIIKAGEVDGHWFSELAYDITAGISEESITNINWGVN